jgi:hypothetical protein
MLAACTRAGERARTHSPGERREERTYVVVVREENDARATLEVPAMTTHDDDEIQLILSEIERRVGSFANGQREKTINAICENADGVLALANRIAANPAALNKVAVFVTSIDRGEHRLAVAPTPADTPPPPPRRSPAPQPLTLEQVERNRRLGPIMRRTHALGATREVEAAMHGLTGHAALDAAEARLDELEAPLPGEPVDARSN